MKLAEAFAKKAYRDRNKVEATHCTGEAKRLVTYRVTINPSVWEQLWHSDDDAYVHDVINPLYDWLETFGKDAEEPEWNDGVPTIDITVPGRISLEAVTAKVNSFLAHAV